MCKWPWKLKQRPVKMYVYIKKSIFLILIIKLVFLVKYIHRYNKLYYIFCFNDTFLVCSFCIHNATRKIIRICLLEYNSTWTYELSTKFEVVPSVTCTPAKVGRFPWAEENLPVYAHYQISKNPKSFLIVSFFTVYLL